MKEVEIQKLLNQLGDKLSDEDKDIFTQFASINKELKLDKESFEDPEYFYYCIKHRFDRIQKGAVKTLVKDCRKITWIYLNYYFLNNLLKNQIQIHEGSACSVDKSRFIIKSIIKFLLDGTQIMGEPKNENMYWRTHCIFDNHDWVINFFEAAHSLHMGSPLKYLEELKYIAEVCPIIKKQKKND